MVNLNGRKFSLTYLRALSPRHLVVASGTHCLVDLSKDLVSRVMQALASSLTSTQACGEGCVGLWVGNLQTGSGEAVRRVSRVLQIATVLGLHWPMCMVFANFELSRVSIKKEKGKERKVIYPKDSKVWT